MLNINQYPTYVAVSSGNTPGTQDAFTLTGSATSKVYVLKAGISNTQTTAGVNNWSLLKRSSVNTGGTHAAPTVVPYQSSAPAATASVLQYTVNPTAGTLVGNVWSGIVDAPAPATAGIGGLQGIELNFESMRGQPIALLNASEVLAWNFNGVTVPAGLAVYAWVVWMEIPVTP